MSMQLTRYLALPHDCIKSDVGVILESYRFKRRIKYKMN